MRDAPTWPVGGIGAGAFTARIEIVTREVSATDPLDVVLAIDGGFVATFGPKGERR